ncbi:MAG: hypothetical protein HKM93_13390 [Desulfobacteraceae bacterium]|nr:hypothetical protein [Desulfobacteraceae bacterium]
MNTTTRRATGFITALFIIAFPIQITSSHADTAPEAVDKIWRSLLERQPYPYTMPLHSKAF